MGGGELTLSVPAHVSYTLEFGDVDGYATPDTQTYTAVDGNARSVTAIYNTEVVSITLSADNGESVVGQVVTIYGTEHTWDGTTITQKIPFGTTYEVSVNDKDGYTTPAAQSYTAAKSVRDLALIYEASLVGIFIQDTYGNLYTEDEWDGTQTANGIAVITENCSFVMALEDAYSTYCEWGGYGTTVSGITTATNESSAQADYDGKAQTATIIRMLGTGNAPAAEYCRAYSFPDGSTGYLGAAGEWQAASDNKSAIESALSTCDGTGMSNYYWTSTQRSSDSSWYMHWLNERLAYFERNDNFYVRAFAAI